MQDGDDLSRPLQVSRALAAMGTPMTSPMVYQGFGQVRPRLRETENPWD
jgi:hypothetical protein